MKTRLFTFIRFVVLLIVSLVWAVPLLWALWAAIRPASMVTKFNFDLNLTIENFKYVFKLWDFSTYLRNSLLIVTGTLAVQLVTVTLAAYAVSRIDFAGKKLFMDHKITSIQDYIDTETLQRYDAVDINVYQANLFHTKMLIKEIDLQNYLFNTDVYELPPKTRLAITDSLRKEMIEVFSGSNIY